MKRSNLRALIRTIAGLALLVTAAVQTAAAAYAQAAQRLNTVTSIAFDRDDTADRVTIFLHRIVSYKSDFLDSHADGHTPYRLFVDLLGTQVSPTLQRAQDADGSQLMRIRVGQYNDTTARIVLDIKNKIYREDYRITSFENPPAVVIELYHKPHRPAGATAHDAPGPSAAAARPPAVSGANDGIEPAEDAGKKCVIVIDPGHGGKDPGAIGYNGIQEKDVCLAISLELKRQLESSLNCRTILTRTSDCFLSLDDRALIANSSHADIFLSIHANSHDDFSLSGIETYYLNFSSDATARRVAARENFTTPEQISDLEMILFDLMQSDKINRSSILAGFVHNALVAHISKKYDAIRNLGVKHAPMRVLIDAEMPCILIETAFLSNPGDAKRLKSTSYQKVICRAIVDGIRDFNNGFKTAYFKEAR